LPSTWHRYSHNNNICTCQQAFENKKKVILVIWDMYSALDLIDKSILIPNLSTHGFPERVIAIYNHFFSGRKVVVQW
jgi:predicted HAD superfamily hydrolase